MLLALLAASMPALADNYLILPFFNLSKETNLQWIGESLSEAIGESLASENVLTLSREDREEAYRRLSVRADRQLTKATVIRLGEALDADQIVYGQFTFTPPTAADAPRTKGTLRIVAQIVNLRKATRGPEYTELGSLEDLARLQNHIAWQTLQFVSPKTAPSEEEYRARRPAIRVEAIENYVRGLLADTADQKFRFFSQAVRVDPRFSQANFQLGRQHYNRKSWKLAAEHLEKVAPQDIRFREARFYLGLSRYRLDDFTGSLQSFRAVVDAVPLNEVWNNVGAAQSRVNDPEALASFRKAIEGDPGDPDYHFNAGYALFRKGELEPAAAEFRATLDRRPGDQDATIMLGRCLRRSPVIRQSPVSEGFERLKETYEESAWLQLKAVLEPKKK